MANNKVTLKSVFGRIDKNDDKNLSKEEVSDFVEEAKVGWVAKTVATKGFMKQFDANKNGKVEFDEFVSKSRSVRTKVPNLKAQASAFADKADKNKDGALVRSEIASTVEDDVKRKGGAMAETIANAASKLSVALLDEDHDGKVSREELESLADDLQGNVDEPE